ncbi:YeeE/YedE family protein [Formosa algae]|uniref:Membrane protein YedE/YeeE n=1 Tax=Formosa algae TaxID=225843 RepID=A0A9X0YM18_9FLAO|nr:YeeE/YedE thiosulfate transporter family protein [Formosa algae]MBP1839712.1 putative membrane protein YedE/YeeE [Formosa algae]MDQ0335311.1 putative membrane protein YedE/YeeE [Formosa algae]OEI80056.1 YeeE/YedE family protein [Formosa algae]PNW25730.1 YeeE/YedE family protein [Formosa algae]
MDFILQPWSWFVSGFLIALLMFVLLLLGKRFGMSSNLRAFCSMCGGGRVSSFFNYNWKKDSWNLFIVIGAMLGGFIASHYLSDGNMPAISTSTKLALQDLNISAVNGYLPEELFSVAALSDVKTWAILIVGGFLVGFGARYAGGCTSGHAISGLSNLQLPSLIAVVGFFIGGLFMVHVLFPFIF